MIKTLGQWFSREWHHGNEINFFLLGLIFLAVLPTSVEMLVGSVGWLGDRFPKVFLCLLASGSAALLNYLGAPAYVVVLSFAAASAGWGAYRVLYQEILRSREEAVKGREVLSEAVVRATYSIHRLLLISPKERERHEADDNIQPDPFHTVRVLERFIGLAEEKGVYEARRFLAGMDLVQLQAWRQGPSEMNLQLDLALAAEFKQSHPASTKPQSESGNLPITSQVPDASASTSAGIPPAI